MSHGTAAPPRKISPPVPPPSAGGPPPKKRPPDSRPTLSSKPRQAAAQCGPVQPADPPPSSILQAGLLMAKAKAGQPRGQKRTGADSNATGHLPPTLPMTAKALSPCTAHQVISTHQSLSCCSCRQDPRISCLLWKTRQTSSQRKTRQSFL